MRRELAVAACVAACAPAVAGEPLRNAFDDPFFQITSALPGCPLPAGPYVTDAERRVQAHHRAEKGTTCWLAQACDRPSAYAHDRDIAAALQAALRERNPYADTTTLWVTVQAGIVYVDGCARRASQAAEIEADVRALPHVVQAVAALRTDPRARPPYRQRQDPPARPQ